MLEIIRNFMRKHKFISKQYTLVGSLNVDPMRQPEVKEESKSKKFRYDLIIAANYYRRKMVSSKHDRTFVLKSDDMLTKKEAKRFFRNTVNDIFENNPLERYTIISTLFYKEEEFLKLYKRESIINRIKR